jgi:hypothetical protein
MNEQIWNRIKEQAMQQKGTVAISTDTSELLVNKDKQFFWVNCKAKMLRRKHEN